MNPAGVEVQEGSTRILVPEAHSKNGPGKIEGVFFNEQMAFNRDVSVMLLKALGRPRIVAADAMCATGARSVRIANEVPGTEVVANDRDPETMPYVEANIELNGLDNCTASNKDIHCLFSRGEYDYVDLDPFGSPSLFIQSAIRGCRRHSILAVTATDTAPLAGAQAPKCRRRYQCEPARGYMCHEGGLRILLCNIAREMGKFDKGMRPILSFYADHYYRAYVEILDGTKNCDRMLDQLGYLRYDQQTLQRDVTPEYDPEHRLGPFWLGNLFDKELLEKMSPEGTAKEKRCNKELEIWRQEIDDVPYLYDMSELSSFTKISPPSLEDMIGKLNETGRASRTHFCPTSFVTDLPLKEIIDAYSEIGHRNRSRYPDGPILYPRPNRNPMGRKADVRILEDVRSVMGELESALSTDDFVEPIAFCSLLRGHDELVRRAKRRSSGFLFRLGLAPSELKRELPVFLRRMDSVEDEMHEHNRDLARSRAKSEYDTICPVDGKMLDVNQVSAITMDVDNRLVIAGAGTGKTATVIGLVKYLLKTGRASPDDILFLSYTNSAVKELADRLRRELGTGCDVSTFHSLAMRIIGSSEGVRPRVTSVDLTDFIYGDLENRMKDRGFLSDVISYAVSDDRYIGDESTYDNADEYTHFIENNPLITLKGDRVKSHGEAEISDWLYMNGVEYVYEEPYCEDTRDRDHGEYRPDFHIAGTNIYIEYFGIDSEGEVAPFMKTEEGSKGYLDSMSWKSRIHEEYGTRLIPLYYHRKAEGKLIDDLKEALEGCGVQFTPPEPTALFHKAIPNGRGDIRRLASEMAAAVTLIKGAGGDWDEAYPRGDTAQERRALHRFGRILRPVYEDYEKRLRERDEIDFEDMLNIASECVEKGLWMPPYRYVVIDEYQDISRSRMRLLRDMRDRNRYRLFCVGDDWQSIYRFNGSDVGYILDFQRYWGPSETMKLGVTYRFAGDLLDKSCGFMNGSDRQIDKTMTGKGKEVDVKVLTGYGKSGCTKNIEMVLDLVPDGESVVMLGRYRYDISLLESGSLSWENDPASGYYRIVYRNRPELDIIFMTIHGSKGLEADHVFIINNRNGRYGFPASDNENPVVRTMLKGGGTQLDEERRLMYVAMTRAKKALYMIAEKGNESGFVREISPSGPARCPRCGKELVLRKGPYGIFYGCTGYVNGCRYIRNIKRR